MHERLEHSAGLDLLLLERLCDVKDRRVRNVVGVEDRLPFRARPQREDLLDDRQQLRTVLGPVGRSLEAWILDEILTLDRVAEVAPEPSDVQGEHEMSVLDGEAAIGHDAVM